MVPVTPAAGGWRNGASSNTRSKRGLIVIEDFPAGVCRRCGEKVVKADVGRLVAELVEGSRRLRKTRTMSVPVIKFVNNVA
jgi:hypothetical protein